MVWKMLNASTCPTISVRLGRRGSPGSMPDFMYWRARDSDRDLAILPVALSCRSSCRATGPGVAPGPLFRTGPGSAAGPIEQAASS